MKLEQWLEVLRFDPADSLGSGRLRAIRRELDRDDTQGARILDELLQTPRRPDVPPRATVPWWDIHRRHDGQPKPLGEADFRWLDRLANDPAKISDQDARVLAGLMLNSEPGSADQRLVATFFDPVRDLHERRVAAANLADLRRTHTPVPPHPPSVLVALTAAVEEKHPELLAHEAQGRARALLAELASERDARHAETLARAEAAAAPPTPTGDARSTSGRRVIPTNWWDVPAS